MLHKNRPGSRLVESTYGEYTNEHHASHAVCEILDLKNREEGQDLVEYALVVALIAFGAVAGMSSLATGINNAFTSISTTLATDI